MSHSTGARGSQNPRIPKLIVSAIAQAVAKNPSKGVLCPDYQGGGCNDEDAARSSRPLLCSGLEGKGEALPIVTVLTAQRMTIMHLLVVQVVFGTTHVATQ